VITLDPSEVENAPSVPRRHQPRTSPHFTPKTHVFSQSAWLRANPKGDVKRAFNRALELGYRVVK
jgi:hypothetical protein